MYCVWCAQAKIQNSFTMGGEEIDYKLAEKHISEISHELAGELWHKNLIAYDLSESDTSEELEIDSEQYDN